MRLGTLVWRELFERKNQLVTSFLAILLGIAAVVAIRNVTYYSEKAVARELDTLGSNILILPKSASVQGYYTADMQGEVFPEEYVSRLAASGLQGIENLSPKLSVPVAVGGRSFTLTGILPKNEFQAKAAWLGSGVFSPAHGCGTSALLPGQAAPPARETLVRRRVVEAMTGGEALVGAEVRAALGLKEGDELTLLGRSFAVSAALPETGTVDDSRIFVHLHSLQKLAELGPVVNAIEIVGCCSEISKGLVQKINALLPEAKVVTVTQVVDTQIRTNRMMSRLSLIFLGIIVLVGGAGIANYMYANVFERRREIGTLMAMGASSSVVLRLFLLKAVLLGLAGGVGGYALGTALAVAIGPHLADVAVLPMPMLALWGIGLSVLLAVAASYFPARRAARADPCAALQEN